MPLRSIRDTEVQRLQGLVNALRDGGADKLKNALLGEAREEARRAFDGERLKLQQEVILIHGRSCTLMSSSLEEYY